MNVELLNLFKTVVITVGIPLLIKYAGKYVSNENRRFKVGFAADIVTGAIEVLRIQKGVSSATAIAFSEIVAAAKAALISQGFDPAKAGGIAEREAAKALQFPYTSDSIQPL